MDGGLYHKIEPIPGSVHDLENIYSKVEPVTDEEKGKLEKIIRDAGFEGPINWW